MRVAVIGAGKVGMTLGRAWARAGHEIVYGVRERAASAPHEGARVDSVRGAATAGDVVALVVPWAVAGEALAEAGDLAGKPLVDVTNPIGPGFALALGHTTSGAERVAALAPSARVVKAFNTTGLENMANPAFGARRVVMPVAGDDADAVATVAKLASDIGFEPVALKALLRARELEPLALLWVDLAMRLGHGRNIAFGLARREPGDRAPAARTASARRRIAIVGSGNIGGALARAWLRAGHDVRIATRDASAKDVAELVALGATTAPIEDGARDRDVVVFAIPAGAVVDVAKAMGGLAGKIVVDCTNAIAKGFTLQFGHTTSSAEELAKALPAAKVVRAFNQQGAEVLQNPVFGGVRATTFVASDDEDARGVIVDLATDAGLDAVPTGPLASSRLLEPITLLWVAMAQALGTREIAITLLRR